MSRQIARGAAAVMAIVIALLTLWPLPQQSYRASVSPVTCLVCGDQGLQDVFQNIMMFLPLGVALGFAGLRPRTAALVGFCLSLFVETLQHTVVTGRDASLSDLLTNTLGAGLGAAFAPHLPRLLSPDQALARRLAVGAALLWAALWIFGAWAIGNDPGKGRWRGRFPGDLPDAPPFNGEALSASLNAAPLRLVPAALPGSVEDAFARDSFVLEATVRVGPPIAWRENVVTVIDSRLDNTNSLNSLVFTLNRVERWALLNFRINAARIRLRTPSFNMGAMFDVPPGGEVRFSIARSKGMLRGSSEGGAASIRTEHRLAPELLWSVLGPRSPRTSLVWQVEALLWAAGLLGFAGYWSGRAQSLAAAGLSAMLALIVQLLTPRAFDVAYQSPLGWVMLLVALVTGYAFGTRWRARSPLPLP